MDDEGAENSSSLLNSRYVESSDDSGESGEVFSSEDEYSDSSDEMLEESQERAASRESGSRPDFASGDIGIVMYNQPEKLAASLKPPSQPLSYNIKTITSFANVGFSEEFLAIVSKLNELVKEIYGQEPEVEEAQQSPLQVRVSQSIFRFISRIEQTLFIPPSDG